MMSAGHRALAVAAAIAIALAGCASVSTTAVPTARVAYTADHRLFTRVEHIADYRFFNVR